MLGLRLICKASDYHEETAQSPLTDHKEEEDLDNTL